MKKEEVVTFKVIEVDIIKGGDKIIKNCKIKRGGSKDKTKKVERGSKIKKKIYKNYTSK